MSDDEQGAIPEENQPESEAADQAPAPDPEESADQAGEAGSAPPDAPVPEGAEEGAEEVSDDAAAALAAAQAAISDAMAGDLTGSAPEASAVDAAKESVAAANDDIEAMMAQAMEEEGVDPAAGAASFAMPSFSPAGPAAESAEMQLLGDVNVDVRIELGRTRMLVEDVLRLGEGAVVELEKLAGDPVDVFVNGRHVARGEVLVLNESFCVRVNEVLEPVTIESAEDS